MGQAEFQPLAFERRSEAEMRAAAEAFRVEMARRRTVRDSQAIPCRGRSSSRRSSPRALRPSGANQQPGISRRSHPPNIKARIRGAAEEEEKAFYAGRAGEEWLDALSHLGTDWEKPFLTEAPWLIAIFAQRWGEAEDPGAESGR